MVSNTPGSAAKKKRIVSRSEKAGLTWSVSRTHRKCNQSTTTPKNKNGVSRIGAGAPVFLAAMLEYVAGEIFELAYQACTNDKKSGKRMQAKHVLQAIRGDKELCKALQGIRVVVGDKIKNPARELVVQKKAKSNLPPPPPIPA